MFNIATLIHFETVYNFQNLTLFVDLKLLLLTVEIVSRECCIIIMSHDIRGIPKTIYSLFFQVHVTL